jgi:protein-disulfide isomerase
MLIPPVQPGDHKLGPDRPAVTLVEFGDFECSFCGEAHPIVKETLQRMPDAILFVFRHFPLSRLHPHAQPAALAAEAAGAQGQFWPMHDMLFESQDALEDEDLVGHAKKLDLDVNRFVADVHAKTGLPKIRADFRSGVRSGANGTPTFFVDGHRFDGSWEDGSLTRMLVALAREPAAALRR